MRKHCLICNKEFDSRNKVIVCCSEECHIIRNKKWHKEYSQTSKGKETRSKAIKKYQQTLKGKEMLRKAHKKYRSTLEGKEKRKKRKTNRDRDLDFIPLNNWFEGSEGHHINKTYVIYIPKELHDKFKGHSARLNRKMRAVNLAAFDFLINGKV